MQESSFTQVRGRLFELESGKVYPHHEIDLLQVDNNDWRYWALGDFSERLNNDRFPCLFGRKAWNGASIRFLFCDLQAEATYGDFLAGLSSYTTFVHETPLNDRLFAPLVVFFEEAFTRDVPQQHSIAWDALNWIHARDPAPWPPDVPLDPEDAAWCFCFNGIQLFINMSVANHKILQSRNLGRYLTLVINPRKNFDSVASIHTESGRLVRERIRSRIAAFNGGVVPLELGFYGEADNREWKQYQLSEEGLEKPLRCPFHSRAEGEGN